MPLLVPANNCPTTPWSGGAVVACELAATVTSAATDGEVVTISESMTPMVGVLAEPGVVTDEGEASIGDIVEGCAGTCIATATPPPPPPPPTPAGLVRSKENSSLSRPNTVVGVLELGGIIGVDIWW